MKPPKHAFAWLVQSNSGIRMEFSEEVKTSLRIGPYRARLLADALRKVADELERRYRQDLRKRQGSSEATPIDVKQRPV